VPDTNVGTKTMNEILRAEEVHKAYHIGKRAVEVLHGVSLSVQRGETLSVMGASGSGKQCRVPRKIQS